MCIRDRSMKVPTITARKLMPLRGKEGRWQNIRRPSWTRDSKTSYHIQGKDRLHNEDQCKDQSNSKWESFIQDVKWSEIVCQPITQACCYLHWSPLQRWHWRLLHQIPEVSAQHIFHWPLLCLEAGVWPVKSKVSCIHSCRCGVAQALPSPITPSLRQAQGGL